MYGLPIGVYCFFFFWVYFQMISDIQRLYRILEIYTYIFFLKRIYCSSLYLFEKKMSVYFMSKFFFFFVLSKTLFSGTWTVYGGTSYFDIIKNKRSSLTAVCRARVMTLKKNAINLRDSIDMSTRFWNV